MGAEVDVDGVCVYMHICDYTLHECQCLCACLCAVGDVLRSEHHSLFNGADLTAEAPLDALRPQAP